MRAISPLSIQYFGKEHRSETHSVLPDGQPPTVAFTVLAQPRGPKANETEMGATLFTKTGEGRIFDFEYLSCGVMVKRAGSNTGLVSSSPARVAMKTPSDLISLSS